MDLTPENVRTFQTTVITDWRRAYGETPVNYREIAMEVPSSGSRNDYQWFADLPSVREWIGERTSQNLSTHDYQIKNKTWEFTVDTSREDFEDNNLGPAQMMAEGAGAAFAKHPDQLIIGGGPPTSLMQGGHALLCFDGQNFFDTDHPVNPKNAALGTYQNYWASGKALTQANFIAMRSALMSRLSESGRSLALGANLLLVVPPALEHTGKLILEADLILQESGSANAVTNMTKGLAKLRVWPELAGQDTTWYILEVGKPIKPFVFQRRRAPQIQMSRSDSIVVLEQNKIRVYGDSRDNAGFTLPFLASKMVA